MTEVGAKQDYPSKNWSDLSNNQKSKTISDKEWLDKNFPSNNLDDQQR